MDWRNRLDFKGLPALIAGLIILSLVFIWASKRSPLVRPIGSASLGQVAETSGSSEIIQSSQGETKSTSTGQPLFDSDVIQTTYDSTVTVQLGNGTRVRWAQNTRARFEVWNNSDKESPILIILEQGQIDLKNAARAKVFVVANGEFRPGLNAYYTTDGFSLAPEMAKTAQPEPKGPPQPPIPEVEPPPPPIKELPKKLPPKKSAENSLSNTVIKSRLDARLEEFERCRLNRVRSSGPVIGELQMAFAIETDGKVKEVKVLNSTVNDMQVVECARRVVAATTYPPFSGEKIYTQYPITYR